MGDARFFSDDGSDSDKDSDDDSNDEGEKKSTEGISKNKGEKSMKIKDVLRREILDQMDNEETVDPTTLSSDDENEINEQKKGRGGLMYDEEQKNIRNELLKEASKGGVEDSDDEILFEQRKRATIQSADNLELVQKGENIIKQLQQDSEAKLIDPRG